ncbi:hypothetical protein Hanom_Chr04g00357361 [Helianthus anomalus]
MGIYIYPMIREGIVHIFHLLALFSLDSSKFRSRCSKEIQAEEGPVPALKWDQCLFEQIARGFWFPPEWDAQYPRQGQTAADAPPGYITLFEDFFLEGNFRFPETEFMASIIHFYGFHISQMSLVGIVRVRHFEFLCDIKGMNPLSRNYGHFTS